MFGIGGVGSDDYEIGIFPLGSVEFTGAVDSKITVTVPVDATVTAGILSIVFEGLFATVPTNATVTAGLLDILFEGLAPVPRASANITAGTLDIVFSPLLIYGPKVLLKKKVITKRYWILTIRSIDLLPDILIPMSSFQEYLNKDSVLSYVINIPDGDKYITEIKNRIDSTFFITSKEVYTDETFNTVDTRDIHVGSVSGVNEDTHHIVLKGASVYQRTEPKKIILTGISSIVIDADGTHSLVADNDKDFLSGDTAVFGLTEFVSGEITRMISTARSQMSVKETKNRI